MAHFLDTVENGFDRLLTFLIGIVAGSIGLFAVLIPLNLLMIKMEWGVIWWLYEGIEYALYVGVFIGAPWVLQQGAHVKVDVFLSALPQHLGVRLEQLVDIFGVLLCLVLAFYGFRETLWEFEDGTLPDKDLRIANWYMMAIFTFSFVLLALEFLFRLRRAAKIVEEEAAGKSEAGF